MIKFLNVYYPTRTVILPICEAILIGSCFLLAILVARGPGDAFIALNYENGWLQIGGVTLITLILSYYFDLYEPQLVSSRLDVYFRVLLVLAFGFCFIVSALIYFFPELGISPNVPVLGFGLLTLALIAWRRAYDLDRLAPNLSRTRLHSRFRRSRATGWSQTLRPPSRRRVEVSYWEDIEKINKKSNAGSIGLKICSVSPTSVPPSAA